MSEGRERVGPVLEAGEVADAIVQAIRAQNADVSIEDRGAYLRVGVPRRCAVTSEEIGRHLGRPFHLPGDLELVMPSFKGRLSLTREAVLWEVSPS